MGENKGANQCPFFASSRGFARFDAHKGTSATFLATYRFTPR